MTNSNVLTDHIMKVHYFADCAARPVATSLLLFEITGARLPAYDERRQTSAAERRYNGLQITVIISELGEKPRIKCAEKAVQRCGQTGSITVGVALPTMAHEEAEDRLVVGSPRAVAPSAVEFLQFHRRAVVCRVESISNHAVREECCAKELLQYPLIAMGHRLQVALLTETFPACHAAVQTRFGRAIKRKAH